MKKKFLILPILAMTLFMGKVLALEPVAKIGTTNYDSIEDAINDSITNEEIVLLEDIGTTIEIPEDKIIILNLNGKNVYSIKNKGDLTVKNGNLVVGTVETNIGIFKSGIINEKEANLKISDIVCNVDEENFVGNTQCIYNNGVAILEESNFNGTNYGRLLYNTSTATLEINSGDYVAAKGIILYNVGGKVVINDGTFKSYDSNYNYVIRSSNEIIINGGLYTSENGYFIENYNPTSSLTINNGTFNCKSVAINSGGNNTITVNNGVFNTTSEAFTNTSILSKGSIITLNGGKINMSGIDTVLGSFDNDTKIVIKNMNIDAPKSAGIHLWIDDTLIIGENDGNVGVQSPSINIPEGRIYGLTHNLEFYDGIINLKSKIDTNSTNIIVPENYYIKYDENEDKTYDAYLSLKQNENDENKSENQQSEKDNVPDEAPTENPKTGNYYAYGILCAVALVGGSSYLIIRKHSKFPKSN